MEVDAKASGIYAIVSPSGKRYVGQSVNIKQRWAGHRHDLKRGKHASHALQRAYNKYGENGLVYVILEFCPADREIITQREQFHMDSTPKAMLYNSAPAAGSPMGMVRSEETRQKIAAAKRGIARSEETCQKMRDAMLGRRHSDATKARMAITRLGQKLKNNKSGYAGVYFVQSCKKWRVKVLINKRQIYLGLYPTAELAHRAHQNFIKILEYYSHS